MADVTGLEQRWEKLENEVENKAQSSETHLTACRNLLADCVEAGKTTSRLRDRSTLQSLARQIADSLYQQTGAYPDNAVILPVEQNEDSISGHQIEKVNAEQQGADKSDSSGDSGAANKDSQGRSLMSPLGIVGSLCVFIFVLLLFLNLSLKGELNRITAENTQTKKELNIKLATIDKLEKERERQATSIEDLKKQKKDFEEQIAGLQQSLELSMAFWNRQITNSMPPDQRISLAIDQSLTFIRTCQLTTAHNRGAFLQRRDGTVWIHPDSGAKAALALLAALSNQRDRPKKKDDLQRVLLWLLWYSSSQNPDGTINSFSGSTLQSYSKQSPSSPSSAPWFLLVLDRYHLQAGETLTNGRLQQLMKAGELALGSILSRVDTEDGLTWENDLVLGDRTKYLIGCVNDYAGLLAAQRFFGRLKQSREEDKAKEIASRLLKGIKSFWRESKGVFATRWFNGSFKAPLEQLYPDVLVNLYSLTWIRAEQDLWKKLLEGFADNVDVISIDGQVEAPPEWWLMAAYALNDKEQSRRWQDKTVQGMLFFTQHNVYIDRPALSLLAILEGHNWLIPKPK